ncbi:MAG: hypothetical protein ACXVAY_22300 [Mucilaginibacter sp.]
MSKTIMLVWQFYKPMLFFNTIFSLVCIYNLINIGWWFVVYTIYIKIVGYGFAILYKNYFANKSYIYYLNAGHSIKRMYVYAFTADFGIYLVMIALLYAIKPFFAA